MKRSLIAVLIAVCFSVALQAQIDSPNLNGVPQGMKFQAVARDAAGAILPNRTVGLKISLGSKEQEYFAEKHQVQTNSLGLFDLAIGGGKVVSGKFEQIPWASEEIWVSISLDAKGTGEYQLVQSTRLLAVPYALHAGTAGTVANSEPGSGSEACPGGTVTGTLWSTTANCNTATTAKFGTADYKPIVFVTDFVERMRILPNGNIDIKRNVTIGENLTVTGFIKSLSDIESDDCTTGAVTSAGGLGVAKKANICGDTRIYSETEATDKDGALFVEGGASLGSLTVRSNRTGSDEDFASYPVQVDGSTQGIAIRVKGGRDNSNNFVAFMDDNGTQGRIEGQTLSELHATAEYQREVALFTLQIVGIAADLVGLVAETVGVAIQFDWIEMIGVIAQSVSAAINLAGTIVGFAGYISDVEGDIGVAYESGSGDYAEWLMRENPSQDFIPGEIVGVKGGKISYKTKGADHVMAISTAPIVLGNMPQADQEASYEKVAFVGQVPVRVIGAAKVGDFILASGNADGYAVAVSPEKMKTEDYARIVGVAWQASNGGLSSTVNVAVGINTNDMAGRLADQERQTNSLQNQINAMMAFLKGEIKSLDDPQFAQNKPSTTTTNGGQMEGGDEDPVYDEEYLEMYRTEIEAKVAEFKGMLEGQFGIETATLDAETLFILDHPVEALKNMNKGQYGMTVTNELRRMRQDNIEKIKKH